MKFKKFFNAWWRKTTACHFSRTLSEGNSYKIVETLISDHEDYSLSTIFIKVFNGRFNRWCYAPTHEVFGAIQHIRAGDKVHWSYWPSRRRLETLFSLNTPKNKPVLQVWSKEE